MSEKMRSFQPAQKITMQAKEEIAAKRFINANAGLCKVTETPIGVSEIQWSKGDTISVITLGTALIETIEAIAVGDKVSVAAEGRAKKKTTDSEWYATALSSIAAGGVVKVKLVC